jgi:hypothetical protein
LIVRRRDGLDAAPDEESRSRYRSARAAKFAVNKWQRVCCVIREERPHHSRVNAALPHLKMCLTITAWRLADRNGHPASCLISERDRRWQVLVWHKTSIVYWERYDTDDAALDRADELWRTLLELGWSSSQPIREGPYRPYRRACPECHRRSAIVTHRHHYPAVEMLCTACKRGWEDRERVGLPDRRRSRRDEDRRHAA